MRRSARVVVVCLALVGCREDSDQAQRDGMLDGGSDAQTRLDAQLDSQLGPDAGCGLPEAYSFRFEGGLSPSGVWSYTVSGSSLRKTKFPNPTSDLAAATCTIPLGCGVPGVDGDELGNVFFPPDVKAAFADTPPTFGLDERAVDRPILVVTQERTGKKLQIGSPCGAVPGCTPIPAHIEALRATLITLLEENGSRDADGC